MLKRLIVEQFVIIDRLDVSFQSGLSIITGDTGAGKSIILDALFLMLGEKSDPASIRQDAEQSIIEARFTPPPGSNLWKLMAEQGLIENQSAAGGKFLATASVNTSQVQELNVRRVIRRDGTEDILLNNKPVKLEFLKKVGTYICEIHGQNANQTLLDPSNQLSLLDLSGSVPPEMFKKVADSLRDVFRYRKEHEEELEFINKNSRKISQFESLAETFKQTGLDEEGLEQIQAEHKRLRAAHESSERFQEIKSHLTSSTGAIKILSAADMALAHLKEIDPEGTKKLADMISGSLESARDAVLELEKLSSEYDIDTSPLRSYTKKVNTIVRLSKELKVPVEQVPEYYNKLKIKIDRIKNGTKNIAQLAQATKAAEEEYREHAHLLTEKRIIAGEALSKSINAELPPLKLLKAEFKVRVDENPNNPWTERGFNVVTFMARMNPGMPFSPIAETASGGEMARLVLAIKVVLQAVQKIPVLIFDEVDVGIGGSAAAAVGERISHLARDTQVLVITHSPQVASRGDNHLHVSKATDGVTTTSVIRELSDEERIDEVSRMLAGDVITDASRTAAQMLIEEARAASSARQ